MDASHPWSERADLKILCGEDSKRLWQARAEKKGRPSKKKYMEPELQFSQDESFQESPFISNKSRMTTSHNHPQRLQFARRRRYLHHQHHITQNHLSVPALLLLQTLHRVIHHAVDHLHHHARHSLQH